MTSRYERILFWSLIGGILLMAIFLLRERQRAHDRLSAVADAAPLTAPYVDTETITFELADDTTGAITAQQREVALPQEPTIRARAILDRLLAEYAFSQSAHPLQSGSAIDEVFLVNLPIANPKVTAPATGTVSTQRNSDFNAPAGQLAIVSLRSVFVQNHPSGIEVEDLTLRSIIGTLHANFPAIQQVRFLVDGQPRDTLAGHADLQRTYPAIDAVSQPQQPNGDNTDDDTPADTQQ